MSALNKQEGGGHYKQMKIQPIEYTVGNGLGFIEGNIIKYITRHRFKNGAEDIRKIIHYCELLLELEYGEDKMGRVSDTTDQSLGNAQTPGQYFHEKRKQVEKLKKDIARAQDTHVKQSDK